MARAQRPNKIRRLDFERFEDRLCMAASVGWDGPGQGSASLTYYIGSAPANFGLTAAEVEAAIEKALAAWSKVADITFTQTNTPGLQDSIDFSFTSIDGPGGTLAQAYFPDDVNPRIVAGDVQIDTAESWEDGNAKGRNAFDLVYVAVHELGHALGLHHSNESEAVLAPRASSNQQFTGLTPDDVDDVLALYAPSKVSTSAADAPETPASTTPSPTVTVLPRTTVLPRRTALPDVTTIPTNSTPTLPSPRFTPKTESPTTIPGTLPKATPTDTTGSTDNESGTGTWTWKSNRYFVFRTPKTTIVPSVTVTIGNRFTPDSQSADAVFNQFARSMFDLLPAAMFFAAYSRLGWR
jgi:hypothetical protein